MRFIPVLRSVMAVSLVISVASCFNGGGKGDFDLPAKSKPAQSSLVRVYRPCWAPNGTTASGVPSCSPAVPLSAYHFGPKGYCALKTKSKLTTPCHFADPPSGSCFDELITIECGDVRDASDAPITSAGGWHLHINGRATERDKNGDMTLGDTVYNAYGSSPILVAPGALSFTVTPSQSFTSGNIPFFVGTQVPSDLNFQFLYGGDFLNEAGMGVIEAPDRVSFASIGGATAAAGACNVNLPAQGKAKKMKTPLVRVYDTCGGVTLPIPNAFPDPFSGFSGCQPPVPASDGFEFGPKGLCALTLQHKAVPCASFTQGCYSLQVQAKCKKLGTTPGGSPVNGPGWHLGLVVRATVDEGAGSETAVDSAVELEFPPAANGTLALKASSTSTDMGLLGPTRALPACTQLQVLAVNLRDPSDKMFAALGRSTKAP